jgi:hypothetical protein
MLHRLEAKLPAQLMEPSVAFQDAWGKTMALPLQICQNFNVSKPEVLYWRDRTFTDVFAVPTHIYWNAL